MLNDDPSETMAELIEISVPSQGDVTYRRIEGELWRIENHGALYEGLRLIEGSLDG